MAKKTGPKPRENNDTENKAMTTAVFKKIPSEKTFSLSNIIPVQKEMNTKTINDVLEKCKTL